MKVTWLGTGSAFCDYNKNWQTNALIELPSGYKLLLDMGGDARHALRDVGLSYKDVDGVYISHLHADHIGSSEYMHFCTYFDPMYKKKPDLFIHGELEQPFWDSVRGGSCTIPKAPVTLWTFWNVHKLLEGRAFNPSGSEEDPWFEIFRTKHVFNDEIQSPSFGLVCKSPNIMFTTDTQYTPNLYLGRYKEAEIVFHDCETMFKSGVHPYVEDFKTFPADYRNKVHFVHFNDHVVDDWDTWQKKVQDMGFAGFVKRGQVFEF